MPNRPDINPAAPLLFVINAAAGHSQVDELRPMIEAVLAEAGRAGTVLACPPDALQRTAQEAAAQAHRTQSAVVAVGGDGTINTVAQAAHAQGCAMGVVPQGTFNYFARTHGIPSESDAAVRTLLTATPTPVQVAGINDRLFLVNASLGLYPDLLEDREAFKARFGRSRWVALWAACVTLLRAQQHLRLRITHGNTERVLRTLTLFVGNNRLQLEQLGLLPPDSEQPAEDFVTAVVLRPVSTWSMLALMLRGAMGTLGEAESIEHFPFEQLTVQPRLPQGRRGVKVAFDGEVSTLRAPLNFRVMPTPLYLLKPSP